MIKMINKDTIFLSGFEHLLCATLSGLIVFIGILIYLMKL